MDLHNRNFPTHNEKNMDFTSKSFRDAYKKMLTFKTKSILIPLKTEGNWTVENLVECLLRPLDQIQSEEIVTIILSSADKKKCEITNSIAQSPKLNGKYDCFI